MKKKLILVAAPPACGKTYVSELISKAAEHIVYLDKDDLSELIRRSFELSGQKFDMDGEFYINNLRTAEYNTILKIAFSALRFDDLVILNAPFVKEVRNIDYMLDLKKQAALLGAELVLIWVTAPPAVCYERMKTRNSDRDKQKLENWEEYIQGINYSAPKELVDSQAVDSFIVFDTTDNKTAIESLKQTMKIINGDS